MSCLRDKTRYATPYTIPYNKNIIYYTIIHNSRKRHWWGKTPSSEEREKGYR
jgi:hypothetical protein